MITFHKVDGYAAYTQLLNKLKNEKNIVLYFAGSVNAAGENWCPDCSRAEPIVMEVMKENEHKTFHFVHAVVGTREQWRDPQCPFKKDKNLKLTCVPTLMVWGTEFRLNDKECQVKENVRKVMKYIK